MSSTGAGAGEQLSLVRASTRRERSTPAASDLAAVDPVAVVLVDVGLAHLDRPFEYTVPDALADTAVPGARVRVRFAGQDVDGFVLERRAEAEHEGRLAPLRRVVSPEPVLTPALLALGRAVAERYAGTLGDVLRLAIPPRHATAEKNLRGEAPEPPPMPEPGPWAGYPAGPSFLRRVASGQAPAASWLALPGQHPQAGVAGAGAGALPDGGPAPGPGTGAAAEPAAGPVAVAGGGDTTDWPAALAVAAGTALAAGRGAVLVVPDHRDVDRVDAALKALLGTGQHVRLTAGQGPQARYTAWLKLLRGHVRCVVGTRAAMFAPVRDLGLVAWWDDGDDLLTEPRAPYPHVREVLALRARTEGAALLSGGFTRTTAVQRWVEAGEVHPVVAAPAAVRRAAPRVLVAGEGTDVDRDGPAAMAHLPSAAWRAAKAGLERGPVLIQVPRRGYLPSLSCQTCREAARCPRCAGPLALTAPGAPPSCRWCGAVPAQFECPHCAGRTLRSSVVGARRTAEELGRAFAGVPVHTSGSGEVLAGVDARPSLVIATPGAEPVAHGGYAATLLLDAWASLDRPTLDAAEEALRRWTAAAALTRAGSDGGVVVLAGAPTHATLPVVEALVRWDPAWFAARELAERVELSLPPTVRMAQLVGTRHALQDALERSDLPADIERLGPLPLSPGAGTRNGGPGSGADDRLQVLLRSPLDEGAQLSAALVAMRAVRSARKEREPVTVRVDPADGIG
jgi:primosomal protein N' (replication factor Y) (superfamily II helicase)